MNDRETFLARWSRRKHTAAAEPANAELPAPPAPAPSGQPLDGNGPAGEPTDAGGPNEHHVASRAESPDTGAPPFDPASLPPIESIVADTDIRAFLAPGVPPELTHAALRRAWAADPKIRDFVGLADYDWDFNTPGSMAGFGPLEMTQELRQIAARIMGSRPVAETSRAAATSEHSGQLEAGGESPPAGRSQDMAEREVEAGGEVPSPERDSQFAAAQNRPGDAEKSQIVVRPRHGGALPK